MKITEIMKNSLLLATALAAGIGFGLTCCPGPLRGTEPDPPAVSAITDTSTIFDTIPYYSPVPKEECPLATVTRTFPIAEKKTTSDSGAKARASASHSGAIEMSADQVDASAGLSVGDESTDSVSVTIPVTQKEYEGKEYHAWVSGYEPSLDSIMVYPRREVITIRLPPDKPKHWGIGIFAGYGITPQGLQPCVGISVNYTLWNF